MLNSQIILDGLVFPELRDAGPLHDAGQSPLQITYSLHNRATAQLADHVGQVESWTRWTDETRAIVRGALADIESFINVEFVQLPANRNADLPIGLVSDYTSDGIGGQVYYTFRYSGEELVDFDASMSIWQDADPETYYHELGHALGLKHPFEAPLLPEAYDNYGYTVMSYDRDYDPGAVVFDTTHGAGEFRRLDVIALQWLYGAADTALSFAIDNFGADAGGWSSQTRFPRQMGDVDGDGRADIVGFGSNRVLVARAGADGEFTIGAGSGIADFARAQGWRSDEAFPRLLGDIDGDGRDDIVGFGARKTFTALSDGSGGFDGFGAGLDNFARAQGWRSANDTPRVLGDVNGDGIDDIIGFGAQKTFTALGRGDGTFGDFRTAIVDFSRGQGWSGNDTFLRLAGDVNGDGMEDIIGFGSRATYTALAVGDGTFRHFSRAIEDFSRAQGWGDDDRTPRMVGDVNGDGRADIVAFGHDIVHAALGTAEGVFEAPVLLSDDFTLAAGWTDNDRLPRQLADVNGDGLDDLVGFSESGVLTRLTVLDGDSAETRLAANLLPDSDWFDFA